MLQKVFSVLVLSGVLAAPVLGAQNAPSGQEARAAKPPVMVNLNTASLAELETLPGIGPKVAARIVEYRKMKGPFKKIEEISRLRQQAAIAVLRVRWRSRADRYEQSRSAEESGQA